MATASDIHFELNEKIEKVRPRRNDEGNIKKCIFYCEKGMENLEATIKEWKMEYEINAIPPSLPCRDQLIKSYLMIAEYEKAESVVTRAQNYGTWDTERADQEIAFIKNVRMQMMQLGIESKNTLVLYNRTFIKFSLRSIKKQ